MKVPNATNRMSKELTHLLAVRDARIRALEALVNRAIAVVNEWIVPNGCSAEAAMGAMIEIFDSPEQRAAMP